MLLTRYSRLSSRMNILRGGRSTVALRYFSYDFLEESLRWRERCTTKSSNAASSSSWLIPLSPKEWSEFIESIQSPSTKEWLESQANSGLIRVPSSLIPDLEGSTAFDLLMKNADDSSLPPESIILLRQEKDATASEGGLLPPSKQWSSLAELKSSNCGVHQVLQSPEAGAVEDSVASYLSSCYSFHRYKTSEKKKDPLIQLSFPESNARTDTEALVGATYWAQDLISTPANDLTPGELQRAAEAWAFSTNVEVSTVLGNDLLTYNGALSTTHGCGMIHAVGRAAMQEPDREPRLIQLRYTPNNANATNNNDTPIAIVGKGVTYDTGGLNLKPGASMLNMKKDMGGAALALGLMRVLVETNFPKPIHCWIPAVENVVDGTSYRPGDVLTSVNGTTTEIGNTDAEGRLVLADALAMACAEQPDLILDFATLTGAQRVALGLDIPGVLVNQPDLMPDIMEAARKERDPVWQLPLWEGYRDRMRSKVADLRNIPSDNGMGGAITAALYLNEFVNNDIPWIHVDFNGLDNSTGLGQAQSLKTMYRFITDRYSK